MLTSKEITDRLEMSFLKDFSIILRSENRFKEHIQMGVLFCYYSIIKLLTQPVTIVSDQHLHLSNVYKSCKL